MPLVVETALTCCCPWAPSPSPRPRSLTGRVAQRVWAPQLDPPPVLADVTVVLVSPKRPVSVGSVARAMSCFECVDLRVVQPRCDHLVRSSRGASKGAQWLLWQAREFGSLAEALEGVDASVAFTRWVAGEPRHHPLPG